MRTDAVRWTRCVSVVGVVWGAMLLPLLAFGQAVSPMAPTADPAFEVATIKPSDPADQNSGFHTSGHHIAVENETVATLIVFAYGVQEKQIVNGPAWFGTDRYDVNGVPDQEGEPNTKQYQAMVAKLLAERFHLRFHRDRREMPIYAVLKTKGGPKLTKTASAPGSLPDQTGNGTASGQDWRFTNCSIADFAMSMQFLLDRPVVDQTGLGDRYDFRLRWSRADAPEGVPDAPPGLFTAVQEQLGLRLEATKGTAEVLVVEGVERPSAN